MNPPFKKRVKALQRFSDPAVLGLCLTAAFLLNQLQTSHLGQGAIIRVTRWRTTVEKPFLQFRSMAGLQQENGRLKQLLAESMQEGRLNHEIRDENRRLRAFLGFAERVDFGFIPAEVIGRQWQGNQGVIHINAGWKQGCQKDMALVTHDGIAGKIVAVSRTGATGILLNHPAFRISARLQRSRQTGIVRWLHGNRCVLEGVPVRSDVQLGDRVVASGYGHIYPPGYLIGHVVNIKDDPRGLFKIVELKTAVDPGQLELLFVIQRDSKNALDAEKRTP